MDRYKVKPEGQGPHHIVCPFAERCSLHLCFKRLSAVLLGSFVEREVIYWRGSTSSTLVISVTSRLQALGTLPLTLGAALCGIMSAFNNICHTPLPAAVLRVDCKHL